MRRALAAVAAVFAVAALPGQAYAAGEGGTYTFDPDARPVTGEEVSADAVALKPATVYRSRISGEQKLYYRLNLDARTNAYVSAVVVPKAGSKVAYGDGITISVRDSSDDQCSSQDAVFGSAQYPRPIAAYASRRVDKDGSCKEAGTYYVLVERESKETSDRGEWDLELRYVSEPQLADPSSEPTSAPSSWPSSSPPPPAAATDNTRHGGAGYYDATSLETGEWKDRIEPGQTLFYRVPVDWGQQLFATAGLSNSTSAKNAYVSSALAMSLENPVLGHVDEVSPMSYSGKPSSVSLDPLPPVAYKNRYDSSDDTGGMRFAGWYYLSVSLSPQVAQAYGDKPITLSLQISVKGQAAKAPYKGDAGIFAVTQGDKDAAREGRNGAQAAAADRTSGTMKLVAAAGIGAGAVLVLWIGAWTLIARRRAVAVPAAPTGGGQYPYGGPPQAW
ncbi:hypothetical protein EAO73_33840 [Streptomyces sp. col6]|uniref:hypothetical protein n=1 Tax=Streptomyces sp. col6 TaxID=2478958 RepID=UPI0011CE297F|nr:hypothetical protein [Streptomyces sp. col6]TXR96483.1 hypothetical protein EAO73_33840 [Streptomyces sp. col6]